MKTNWEQFEEKQCFHLPAQNSFEQFNSILVCVTNWEAIERKWKQLPVKETSLNQNIIFKMCFWKKTNFLTRSLQDFSEYTFFMQSALEVVFIRKHTGKSKISCTGNPFITPFQKCKKKFMIFYIFFEFFISSGLIGLTPVCENFYFRVC